MRKIIMYQRRARYKKLARRRTVISTAIIIVVIGSALVAKIKFQGGQEKVYTKVEVADNSTTTETEVGDNSGSEDQPIIGNETVKNSDETVKSSDEIVKSSEEIVKSTDQTVKSSDETLKKNDETVGNEPVKEEKVLDNSGYLPLEKDPNADDVIELFHTTEKLIKNEISYPVRKDRKKVAYLTFDDGPSTTNTPKILDTLKENGVKGTFFIMGKQLDSSEESKEILKRTVKEGHAIANHTYGHDYNYLYPGRTISVNNFMSDVEKCDTALKNVLGKDFSTRTIRFPGGYWSWEGRANIKPIITEKGYAIIDWNTLNEDAEGKPNKTAEELANITKENIDSLGPNADSVVLLMHDTYGKNETAKSLQSVINIFKEKGFEFRTMK